MNESFYRRNCHVCNAMFHMSCILVNILCLKLSQFLSKPKHFSFKYCYLKKCILAVDHKSIVVHSVCIRSHPLHDGLLARFFAILVGLY